MIPLINEALFKQHSPVSSNTDITEFVPYICIAQELHIEDVLGRSLMLELKKEIKNNSLSPQNSDLILRLAPALSFYAVYQALPFHWASIVNKGITLRESENSKAIDIKDLAQLRHWIKDDADILRNQLIDFLESNKDQYPLWRPSTSNCNLHGNNPQTGSNRKRFDTGFYFKKRWD